ncbi:MAG: hypothetical protein PVG98_11975 [Chromatiales bacterium]
MHDVLLPGVPSSRIHRISAALVVAVSAVLLPVTDCEAARFEPPDLQEFAVYNEHEADGDGDGVNETHVVRYFNPKGDSIFSLTTRGRLWAWSLNTRGDEAPEHNYVIRDSNCDGVFDEVYGLDDEFHIPACLGN